MASFCKHCGAELDPGAAFCPSCGKPVPREVPPQKQFCVSCGAELTPGSAFCPVCGARQQRAVDRSVPAATAARSSSQAQRARQASAAPNRSSAGAPAPADGAARPQPARKKRKGKGPAVLLVLAALGIFAFTAFKSPGFLVKPKRPDPFAVLHTWPADRPSASPAAAPANTASGRISAEDPVVTLCGVTVDADPAMLSSGSREVSVSAYGSEEADGVFYERYELSLGGGEFRIPVEVTFPCRIDADTDVSVQHYEDGEWKTLLSFVDESAGTVSAYFGSFSPARVAYRRANVNPSLYDVKTDPDDPWVQTLEVKDNCWAILRRTNPAVYGPEIQRFIDDPNNYSLPAPRLDPNMELTAAYDAYMQSSQIWGFVDPLINMGIDTLPYESKQAVVKYMIDHSGKLSNAMNAVPFINMGIQLAFDLKRGTSETAGVGLYKNLLNTSGTIYSLVTNYSHLGFSLAFLGVSVFGMELDYFVDAAAAVQAENIRDVYKAYYEKVEPFDDHHWYLVFENAYRSCGGDPDRAMAQVKQAVDEYCEKFWTEVYKDSNDQLIFAAVDAGCKNVFMNASEEQKKALTEQQKREVWQLIETKSMKKIRRFLLERLQTEAEEQLDSIVRDYNLQMRFIIRESVDLQSSDYAKYLGTTLALGRGGKPLPGWSVDIPDDGDLDDGWETEFRCTVYGYLRMGMPDQVLVYASAEDLRNEAPPLLVKDFTPETEGNRETVVELGSGTNVCKVKVTMPDHSFTVTVEGGVCYETAPARVGLYGDLDGHLLRGQVKKGETVTVTVTGSDDKPIWIADLRDDGIKNMFDSANYPNDRKKEFTAEGDISGLSILVIREFAEGAAYIEFAIGLELVDSYTESPVPAFESVYDP